MVKLLTSNGNASSTPILRVARVLPTALILPSFFLLLYTRKSYKRYCMQQTVHNKPVKIHWEECLGTHGRRHPFFTSGHVVWNPTGAEVPTLRTVHL